MSQSAIKCVSKDVKSTPKNDICASMFITALLTEAKVWSQYSCSSLDDWIKRILCKYTMKYYLLFKKEGYSVICDDKYENKEHYIKWNN